MVTVVLLKKSGKWVEADLQMFENEPHFQQLLADDPQLVPGCAGAAVVREFPVAGVGRVDLVAVDDAGTITLIECKLHKNSEIRRSVVGQILAYASGLAGTTFEEFDRIFRSLEGAGILDAVAAQGAPDVDEEALRSKLERALSEGNFRMVVAVDAITDELRTIIVYLNDHLSPEVSIMALELGYLKQGDVELLVPSTYGAEASEAKAAKQSARWSEEEVRNAVHGCEEPQRVFLEQMLKHAGQRKAIIKGGVGSAPSAGVYYQLPEGRLSLWSLYVRESGPAIRLNLGWVSKKAPDTAETMVQHVKSHDWFVNAAGQDETAWLDKNPEIPVSLLLAEPGGDTALLAALDAATT